MLTLAGHLLTVVLTLKSLVINNVDSVDTFPRIRPFYYQNFIARIVHRLN